MIQDFKNKAAIVTGAGSGIGFATAQLFASLNAHVYSVDCHFGAETIGEAVTCNLADRISVNESFKSILKKSPKIDVLVANAGIHRSGTILTALEDDIDQVIDTNLKGTIYSLRAILPSMVDAGCGSIVIVGSDQSFVAKQRNAIYGLTKATVAHLAKSTAIDFAANGIRVNAVCPGTVDTPLYRQAIARRSKTAGIPIEEVHAFCENAQPIKRLATADEVANLIAYIASSGSAYMTGACVSIDGGYTAQ